MNLVASMSDDRGASAQSGPPTLSRPRLDALREVEVGLVRVHRTRRTRVASSGRLVGIVPATGRRIGGTVLDGLREAGLIRYVRWEGWTIAELTNEGQRVIDATLDG